MNKKIAGRGSRLVVIIGLFALSSQLAWAANLYCTGTPSDLYIDSDGNLYIYSSWRAGYTQLCNVEGDWKGIPQQTCWSWYGVLSSAITNAHQARVYYANSAYTCATMPTYGGAEAPYYVMLR